MKKVLIAALIGISALPTAAQAASNSATCGKAFPGLGWFGYWLNPGGGCK